MSAFPSEANSVLVIDTNAALSRAVSFQHLQAVRGRRCQIAKLFGAVDLDQPAEGHTGELLESPDPPALENRLGLMIAKRADQTSIVLRLALNVKQEEGESACPTALH
jgi:hypothetical protein